MKDLFPKDSTYTWQCNTYEGHMAIDIHARYFTLRKDAPKEQNTSFWKGMDPDGVLAKLRKQDLIHGPDNVVTYKKLTMEPNGKISYSDIEPNAFEVGDIVEASFAFVALPVKRERYVMIPQLRGLLLIDSNFRNDKESNQDGHAFTTIFKHSGQLKRKAIYAEDDALVDAQRKIVRMQIDVQD